MNTEQDLGRRLGAKLRELREAGGYTLNELADKLGTDAPGLSRMERGERNISTLVLRRAARVFEISTDDFFAAPASEVVHLRAGDGEQTAAMLAWAADLQRDLRAVRAYEDERSL